MKPVYFFVDLDDTLFQSLPKCPRDQPLDPVGYLSDGTPHSFMTRRQASLVRELRSYGTLIPTTARNSSSMSRVDLAFDFVKILSFGAVVLTPDGTPDSEWHDRIQSNSYGFYAELMATHSAIHHFVEQSALDLTVRIVSDLELPLYIVIKYLTGSGDHLKRLAESDVLPQSDAWWTHCQDRQIACVPSFFDKEQAVRFVQQKYLPRDCITIGIGDSDADAGFIGTCTLGYTPTGSQLFQRFC